MYQHIMSQNIKAISGNKRRRRGRRAWRLNAKENQTSWHDAQQNALSIYGAQRHHHQARQTQALKKKWKAEGEEMKAILISARRSI